jgi:hypothetical protein
MISQLLLIVLIVVIILYLLKDYGNPERDNFQYLNTYFQAEPSMRMEHQDVCEKNMLAHCNLSDGTPGKCVRNGMCAGSFLLDPALYAGLLPAKIPLPYSERDCPTFCENRRLTDGPSFNRGECLESCRARYYPDDY